MHVRYTCVYTVLQLWRTRVHARVLHYEPVNRNGSSLSVSDSTQVSNLVTGNTSTGSESGVQTLLDRLKAPQRSELTQKRMINA